MKVWAACSVMTSFFSLWSLARNRTLSEECSVMRYWASGGLRTYRPAYRIKCFLDAHGCTSTFHHRSYWVVSTTRIALGGKARVQETSAKRFPEVGDEGKAPSLHQGGFFEAKS